MDGLAFVAAAQSPVQPQAAALRGAAALQQAPGTAAPGFSTASTLSGLAAAAVGAAAVARAGARTPKKGRRAVSMRAAAAAAAPVEGEEAPPPPFDPALQLGVTSPLGFFDPLGFCKVGDEEGFRTLRSAELKHGRVAMMASVGAVFQALLPGEGPKGLGAVASAPEGLAALVLVSGALELTIWKDDPAKGVESIGDFGNPLQLGIGEPLGESEDMKNRELNNGRAAMFAVLGIIAAELATGKNALEQLA